ncbi:MAG: peptidoglycan D,D-transpeptidase FtsI family protein [Minisyncoccia bacterium]
MKKRFKIGHSLTSNNRINWIRFGFVFFFIVLTIRLFQLQVLKYSNFIEEAKAIQTANTTIIPQRGLIYVQDKDKNLYAVAINKKYYSIYAVPKEIKNPQEVSQKLAKILPLSYEEIFNRLNKPDDPYELLIKKTDDENIIKLLDNTSLKGIYYTPVNYRYYPYGSFLSQTIGFISESKDDPDIKGRYGLELYYDSILAGEKGVFYGVKDAFGRLVRSLFANERQSQDGSDIITTIDKNVQFFVENALKDLITTREAESGSIIVMEIPTGKIIALANYPDFDLNEYYKVKDYSIYLNPVVQNRFEMGSVVKSLTMASGLDLGLITPDTTYEDKGFLTIGGYKIMNFENRVYGKATMKEVLQWSINTGAVFVGEKVGIDNLRKYFKNFGLDKKTGIDLPNEVSGDLSNLEYPKGNQTTLATASYGLGIAITPIELVRAYSAVANKGYLINPYIVESIKDELGIHSAQMKRELRQVISEETANTLTKMLVNVVENGYGRNAKIKGYSLAGKTGTANIPLKGQKGYSEDTIQSFIGFFPAYTPKFLILVKMDRPRALSASSASKTVTFTFKDIEQYLINYYNIPPDEL